MLAKHKVESECLNERSNPISLPESERKEGSKQATAARVLTPGDAEGAKVRGGGGVGEGEEARIEARRRAVDAGAGAAPKERSDGDGEKEQQGDDRAVGGVQASVGGDEAGVRLPGLGLVAAVPCGGGGARRRAGRAGGEANVVHADATVRRRQQIGGKVSRWWKIGRARVRCNCARASGSGRKLVISTPDS